MNTTTQIQQSGSESSNAIGGGEGNNLEARRVRFAEKQEAKRARFEARAARLLGYADAMYRTSRRITENIPLGQPILVGHHSERGHRADLERSRSAMDRSCKAAKLAEHCQRRAQSVGEGGISSDDPSAVEKLRAELAGMEATQEHMKAVNKVIRTHKTEEARRAALLGLGLEDWRVTQLLTPDCFKCLGYPQYRLTNNLANARRVKIRIGMLEAIARRADVELVKEGYTYKEDSAENRVMFLFEGKPDEEVRKALKRNAFKWSPTRGAWVRQLSGSGIRAGREVRAALDAIAGEAS